VGAVGFWIGDSIYVIGRDDMTTLLSKAGLSLTVKQLLDTLQEVLDFEASILKKFATSVSDHSFYQLLGNLSENNSSLISLKPFSLQLPPGLPSLFLRHLNRTWAFSFLRKTSLCCFFHFAKKPILK
jgi:hypothetical protein